MKVGMLQIQNTIQDINLEGIYKNSISSNKSTVIKNSNASFQEILKNEISNDNSIDFSEKAYKNLMEINGTLSTSQIERLESGLSRLKEKGVKSGVLLMDTAAFTVNVDKQIVLSSMGKEKVFDNIFSNIDAFAVV